MDTSELSETEQWLQKVVCEAFKIPHLRPFQLQHAMDLYRGKDVFLTIATGQGKTIVLLSSLLAAKAKGEKGIGVAIVPTKALAQQLEKTANSVGIPTCAITEDTLREASAGGHNLFKTVAELAGVRLAVMSPQMLCGDRFNSFLQGGSTRRSIRWMLIDEAHLVLEDSSTFCAPYANIAIVRARLPSTMVWCAVTGSLTPNNMTKASQALGFTPGRFVQARYRLDRPNVKYIPRYFQYPTTNGEFLDLSFLIPHNLSSPQDIQPTLIFTNTIATSHAIMAFLDTLIPLSIPNRTSIIKLYNSLMPLEYRLKFVEDMKSGSTLRIGVVTDTLTYGLDIPNIKRVVIFDLCPSPENMKQKIGRPGRDGTPSTVITFAPAWVQEVLPSEVQTQKAKDDLKRRNMLPRMLLQWFNPTLAECPRYIDNIYYGDEFSPQDGCCIVCTPAPENGDIQAATKQWKVILDSRKPAALESKLPRADTTYRPLTTNERNDLKAQLIVWRRRTWNALRRETAVYRNTPSEFLLPNHILVALVNHAHICSDMARFKRVMAEWRFISLHGESLFNFVTTQLSTFKKSSELNAPSHVADKAPPAAVLEAEDKIPSLRLPPIPVIPRPADTNSCPSVLGKKRKAESKSSASTQTKRRRVAKGKENMPCPT